MTTITKYNNALEELFDSNRWTSWRLVWNAQREKWDKVPHNGKHGISTKNPSQWVPFAAAAELAERPDLSGVGLVMTGGIDSGQWRLVGLDFDDVNFEQFKLPFKTYAEKSPSGKGVRAFLWAPLTWVQRFKDTMDCRPPNCNHAEVYLGTTPRFLTVTFDALNDYPIAQLSSTKDLERIEKWGLNRVEVAKTLTLPDGIGVELNLNDYVLTIEQHQLIKGTGQLDRSAIMHGLIIKLIDAGAPNEDVLATIIKTPALWQYCLDHRHEDPTRALQFAMEEIGRGYARSITGMRANLLGFNRKEDIIEKIPHKEDLSFPRVIYDEAPGLVRDIAEWILHASYSPRVEFAYTCALSMTAALLGPYVTYDSRNSKLNLYLVLVGGTGSGKNEAIDVMGMLLNHTDAKDCIQDFPASEAALRRQLNVTPNILIRVDELAHKLQQMQSSSNGSGMGRALLEMYNSQRLPPKQYADSAKSLPAVENPFVQVLGGTTDKVWDVMKSAHMEDGTLNRFIFACLPDELEYSGQDEPSNDVPKVLKDRLNAFFRTGHKLDLIGDGAEMLGRKIRYSEEVKLLVSNLRITAWQLQQQDYGGLYTRFVQNVGKIAAILAASDGRDEINKTDFEQARLFMKWSVTNTYHKVQTRMADTNFEKVSKSLIQLLEKENGKIRLRDAYRRLHIPRRDMQEVVGTLQLAGQVALVEEENNSKSGVNTEWLYLVQDD